MDKTSSRSSLLTARLFLAALACASLVVSPFALDFTLTGRIIMYSLLLIPCFYFLNKQAPDFKVDIITLPLTGYVLFCAFSYTWALNKSEALFDISKALLAFFTFGFSVYVLKNHKDIFLNYFLKYSVILVFIGLGFAIYQAVELKDLHKESLYNITGINGHKNLYSSFLFLNLFFVILAVFKNKGAWKISAVIASIISLALIIFLRTKAVWTGLLITAGAWAFVTLIAKIKRLPKTNTLLLAAITMIACNTAVLFFLRPIVSKAIYHDENATLTGKQELDKERLILWDKTLGMFQKHQFKGVGAGNWQIHLPNETLTGLWRAEDMNYTFQRPHNDALWILSETGLIGFNFFLLFVVLLLFFGMKALRSCTDTIEARYISLAIAFIVGFLAISFFDFPKERVEHLVWINVIMPFVYVFAKKQSVPNHLFSFPGGQPFPALGLLVSVFILSIGILRHKGEAFTRKMYNDNYNKNYSDAIRYAGKAQSFAYTLDPTSVPLDWYKGNAYIHLGNNAAAITCFTTAYQLNPYNRNVLNDLGSAYSVLNDQEKAKKYFEEASRISPRFDEAKLNLAAVYIREKNYKKADECLKSLFHDSERRTNYQKLVDAFVGSN